MCTCVRFRMKGESVTRVGATEGCVGNSRRACREQPNGVFGTGQVRVERVEWGESGTEGGGESGTAGSVTH